MKHLIFYIFCTFLLGISSCKTSSFPCSYSYYFPWEFMDDSNRKVTYTDLEFQNSYYNVYRGTVCDSSSMRFSHIVKELDSVWLKRPQDCVVRVLSIAKAFELNLSEEGTDTALVLEYTNMYNPESSIYYTIFKNKLFRSKIILEGYGVAEVYKLPDLKFEVDSADNSPLADLFIKHPNTFFWNYLYTWDISGIEKFLKYLTPVSVKITASRIIFSKTKIEDFQVLYITDAITRELNKPGVPKTISPIVDPGSFKVRIINWNKGRRSNCRRKNR